MKPGGSRFYIMLAAASLALVLLLAARWLYAAPDGGVELPPSPKITPEPAAIVYVTPNGSKYHRRECSSVSNAASVKEMLPGEAAAAGYEPCLRCTP